MWCYGVIPVNIYGFVGLDWQFAAELPYGPV